MLKLGKFFRQTNGKDWDEDLLLRVFFLLPKKYSVYGRQIEKGLIKGVLHSDKPLTNYTNFIYNPQIAKEFEDDSGRFHCLKGIRVYDERLKEWARIEIYITSGLLCGYRLPEGRNITPNLNCIRIDDFGEKYLDEDEVRLMSEFLDPGEIALINPSEFYEVHLEGKTYYHVKDLEDGDFIGIDRGKRVYRITHDPYEIELLEGNLIDNLTKY